MLQPLLHGGHERLLLLVLLLLLLLLLLMSGGHQLLQRIGRQAGQPRVASQRQQTGRRAGRHAGQAG